MPSSRHLTLFFVLFFFFFLLSFSEAVVPVSKRFRVINNDEDTGGESVMEYGSWYRTIYTPQTPQPDPFSLYFYTNGNDTVAKMGWLFAITIGTFRDDNIMRIVWEANRGNPVHEGASLTFGADGNLVLADYNGRMVWQTNTANKGVVDIKLLPNGNLVLVDKRGKFVWQSFDHPTDTLLVGQSLKLGGDATKLVSRTSVEDNALGSYSLVLESNRLALYYTDKKSDKPMIYYSFRDQQSPPLTSVTFFLINEFELGLDFQTSDGSSSLQTLANPKWNSTYSYLRLTPDGGIQIFTYHNNGGRGIFWDVTFTLFSENGLASRCNMPKTCGSFGVCEDSQCVACPTPKGLLGWSSKCTSPVLPPCKVGANVKYYKIDGVEHFTSPYVEGDGPMKLIECRQKCNTDCGCAGFFYREESSRCMLAPMLGSLTKVSNPKHYAFIKVP